ncbi:hypothetical protein KM043_008316 [Ampulex compressa]|nr:hypothetical protein KM043_008316 [Ampulex compressa]
MMSECETRANARTVGRRRIVLESLEPLGATPPVDVNYRRFEAPSILELDPSDRSEAPSLSIETPMPRLAIQSFAYEPNSTPSLDFAPITSAGLCDVWEK